MSLRWLIEIFKSQGAAIGGFIVILFILFSFMKSVISNSHEREKRLTNLLTNHLEEHNKLLSSISENLRRTSEEHSKMTELLIRINEKVNL